MNRDTILIFEDNAIDREILVELFRSDYKILEAENGREGHRTPKGQHRLHRRRSAR